MIFFVENDGTIEKTVPSPVYQGAANENNIYLIAPFAANSNPTVAFILPNGFWTEEYVMTPIGKISGVINKDTGKPYEGWSFSLPNEITRFAGEVRMQFFFYVHTGTSSVTQRIATASVTFPVGRGVPAVLPSSGPEADIYQAILSNLTALNQKIDNVESVPGNPVFYSADPALNSYAATTTILSALLPQKTPEVGNLILAASGYLFEITEIDLSNKQTIGVSFVGDLHGPQGKQGNPVFYCARGGMDEATSQIPIRTLLPSVTAQELQLGNLLISTSGYLYFVAHVREETVYISFVKSLIGPKGDKGNPIFFYNGAIPNSNTILASSLQPNVTVNELQTGNLIVSADGKLYRIFYFLPNQEIFLQFVQNLVDLSGTYPSMTVGKAINDSNGNNIANQFKEIQDVIPSSATPTNQLATQSFVNSSINNMAAFYITYNAAGDAFPNRADLLNAATYYYGGQPRTPTQNDYAIVLHDESQPLGADGQYPTTRYSYQGTAWSFQYVVNNTSLTQAQIDALNSGITQELVEKLNLNTEDSDKNFYNLGVYDAFNSKGDGSGTVARKTGVKEYHGNDIIQILNASSFTYCYMDKPIDFIGYGNTQNIDFESNKFTNRNSGSPNALISYGDDNRFIAYFALGTTLEQAQAAIDGLIIQYERAEKYQYEEPLIENQPIRPANQEECLYWHEEWEKGLNLCPPLINGIRLDISGNEYADETAATSEYIDIPSSVFQFTNLDGDVWSMLCFYDESMQFIDRTGEDKRTSLRIPAEMNVPPNAMYMRLSYYTNTESPLPGTDIMLTRGNIPYPYEPYYGKIAREKDLESQNGPSLWISSAVSTPSTTSIALSSIEVPKGMMVQVGDLILANATYDYLYKIEELSSTVATVTFLRKLKDDSNPGTVLQTSNVYLYNNMSFDLLIYYLDALDSQYKIVKCDNGSSISFDTFVGNDIFVRVFGESSSENASVEVPEDGSRCIVNNYYMLDSDLDSEVNDNLDSRSAAITFPGGNKGITIKACSLTLTLTIG